MKLEALRRSVVRLFRKSDTSVPPKTGLEIAQAQKADGVMKVDAAATSEVILKELLRQHLQSSGIIPPEDMPGWHDRRQADRPGIKPPSDITDSWTWSQWTKEASAGGVIPGWAFCRFANRLGEDKVGFVFGHVRGGFGVWQQPFDVFVNSYEGVEQRPDILTCVTHLCTGMGLGIFADRATAITAAELAEKVCPSWQTDTPEQLTVWGENIGRTRTAWHAIGIRESTNAHANDRHGTRFPIFGQDNESLMAGKPERLS